jgi:tetrathionate reductase subunit B
VVGATLTLTGADGKKLTATTDGFGDFWFRGLADGATYKLTIAAKGFKDKTLAGISTAKDVNLGEIALTK